jgi:hypothetical protein
MTLGGERGQGHDANFSVNFDTCLLAHFFAMTLNVEGRLVAIFVCLLCLSCEYVLLSNSCNQVKR